jgi:tripartite-type tricarboxylate transporter receptor subunit TctC
MAYGRRRASRLLPFVVSAIVIGTAVAGGAEEAYPSRPVQILVPLPPGGAADLHARPLARVMERVLKQPVVVVNKPGAASAVGTQFVANSKADGYLPMIAMPSFFINPQVDALFARPANFTVDQFVPIARLSADPVVLVVHPARPWKSVAELIAAAKRQPGEISYGTSGNYTGVHLPMEILAAVTGITLKHVPYNGVGPAVASLLGGHLDAMFSGPGPVLAHIRAGTLRALATSGSRRLAALPDAPTIRESGHDFEYALQVGIVVRKGSPPAAVRALRGAVKQAVASPEFESAMTSLGTTVAYLDADEWGRQWERDGKLIGEALRRIGKLE